MCGVIVVDAESFRSTWHRRDAYIHDHCLRYLHNYALFYQLLGSNLLTTVIHAILREATSETYGPRVSFLLYCISFIYIASHLLFCNLYFPIYTTKIFTLLSLSDLTFASDREGIDNPFIVLVARFWIVCAGTRDLRVVSYWIDTLLLKNWGKYLRYFAASPFPLQGKTNTCSRGSIVLDSAHFSLTTLEFKYVFSELQIASQDSHIRWDGLPFWKEKIKIGLRAIDDDIWNIV